MTADSLCIHELDIRACIDCQRGPTLPPAGTVTAVASFQSRCVACDEPIVAGEQITLVENDWTHTRCTDN